MKKMFFFCDFVSCLSAYNFIYSSYVCYYDKFVYYQYLFLRILTLSINNKIKQLNKLYILKNESFNELAFIFKVQQLIKVCGQTLKFLIFIFITFKIVFKIYFIYKNKTVRINF